MAASSTWTIRKKRNARSDRQCADPTAADRLSRRGRNGLERPRRLRRTIDRNMGVAARDLRGLFNITRFRDHVHRGGPWDYKQRGDRYEPYGNFHYGAVGSAAEIAPIVLWNEAGRAQKVDNPDSDGNALGTPGPSPIPWMGTGASATTRWTNTG